ncbi:lysylphosphatidylglycerol synthase domain-containing protein [Acetobacter cibinongensis]|uniref:Transporter n=1 Tax=Acetobacter cibinongensis TaxID=146475 RepID=A0A1Z5YSN7_9PROT|nr:lysylphosphatidylglycerol synthase domain-containing protein [Acetobacter cibinongensis]OUJ01191.1 transporter [Acetobacter cibinongensis]
MVDNTPSAPQGAKPKPQGWKRWLKHLPHLLGLLLMVAAIAVVQHELRHLRLADIRMAMEAIPGWKLGLGVACTFLSYFILSFYDRLAVVQVGYGHLSFGRTAFAAFCSYVLSHNLGFSAVSGAAVRYRLYRNWGVSSFCIAQIIAFCSATYLLGAAVLIGGVLVWEPSVIPMAGAHVPASVLAGVGIALWLAVLAYIGLTFKMRHLTVRQHTIDLPSPLMAVLQTTVAAADVAATAAIAYVLLPAGVQIDYGSFLAIYIASYTAGLVASVPGGLGVFDGAMLLALGPYMPAPQIMGVVLIFRLFYYIIPLFMAGIMFAGHELFLRGDDALAAKKESRMAKPAAPRRVRPSQLVRDSEAGFSVAVATGTVALCGIMLICLVLLDPVAKYGVVNTASATWLGTIGTYLLSVMGVGLIGLAIGLSQRVTLAWRATLGLLVIAAVITFVRGNTVLVPVVLALSAFLIAPFRSCYYRRARLLSEPLSTSTLLCLLLLFGCIFALASRHGAGSWWEMVFILPASGAARWTVALSVAFFLLVVSRLMLPGRVRVKPWDAAAQTHYLTLDHALPDIASMTPDGYVTGEGGEAVIPVFRREGFLVGLGDPAGAEDDSVSAIWRLRDLALQEGVKPAFWKVGTPFLRIYDDIGLNVWPLENSNGLQFCYPADDIALASRFVASYKGADAEPPISAL